MGPRFLYALAKLRVHRGHRKPLARWALGGMLLSFMPGCEAKHPPEPSSTPAPSSPSPAQPTPKSDSRFTGAICPFSACGQLCQGGLNPELDVSFEAGVCNKFGRCVYIDKALACEEQCQSGDPVEGFHRCWEGHCPASGRIKDTVLSKRHCTPCSDASDCASEEEYCKHAGKVCGAWGAQGSCAPRPTSCEPGGEPVCGCDGKRYDSTCAAAQAGVDEFRFGGCAAAKPETFSCNGLSCPKRQLCHLKKPDPTLLSPEFETHFNPLPEGCGDAPTCDCVELQDQERCFDAGGFLMIVNQSPSNPFLPELPPIGEPSSHQSPSL